MLIPTPRLLLTALVGVPVAGLSGSARAAVVVGAVWLAAVVILGLVDGFVVPIDQLAWARTYDPKLSLGAWNPVTLTLHNRSRYRLTLRVRDPIPRTLLPPAPPNTDPGTQNPELFVARGQTGEGACDAGSTWTLDYALFPLHRGAYRFGPIVARYRGPLALVWRQRTHAAEDMVKVYPNLLAIRSYEVLIRRGQLQELGLRNARRWGAGTDFERLREYLPDDEFRRINWPATARRHAPIVVDCETERSQNVMIMLDAGRLMATRVPSSEFMVPGSSRSETAPAPTGMTRLDYAVNAALLLAFVVQQRGDRVGLLAYSDRVTRYLVPRAGRRGFLPIVEALYNLEPEPTEADHAQALDYLAARHPRRSLIVLFTDIGDADAATPLVSRLARLSRRHLILVVTLRDPGIEHLATQSPRDSQAVYERAVARTLLDERETTLRHLHQHGVLTLDVAADQLSPSLINRYLEIKARTAL